MGKTRKDQWKRRKARQYQARSRGDKKSWRTKYEDALIVLSQINGDITEGRACQVLEMDRLTYRSYRQAMIAVAAETAFMDVDITTTLPLDNVRAIN